MIERLINKTLSVAGLRLSRISKKKALNSQLPEVLKDPMDVIYMQGIPFLYNIPVALEIPVADIVNPLGFGYGPNDENPFVQTLKEGSETYEESTLKNYYDTFQPANAAEALRANFSEDFALRNVPAYACRFLVPWSTMTPEKSIRSVESITINENKEHGDIKLGIEGGDLLHGPVSDEKGKIEFKRLKKTYLSIKEKGYLRKAGGDGDIKVYILRSDNITKYIMNSGTHRLASVAALNMESIPVRLLAYHIIEKEYVESWPQVRKGLWKAEDALRYFDLLFYGLIKQNPKK